MSHVSLKSLDLSIRKVFILMLLLETYSMNQTDILGLCMTNFEDQTDVSHFSVRGYFNITWKIPSERCRAYHFNKKLKNLFFEKFGLKAFVKWAWLFYNMSSFTTKTLAIEIYDTCNLFHATGPFLQKTRAFLMFSRGIERDQWHEIDKWK